MEKCNRIDIILKFNILMRALQGDAVCLICCLCLTDYEGFSCQGITGGSSTERLTAVFISDTLIFIIESKFGLSRNYVVESHGITVNVNECY
jgi:hypothetical protein